MKNLILLCSLSLVALGAFGQTKVNLSVEVTNIEEGDGIVHIAMYDSEEAFMDTLAVFRSKSIPVSGQSSVSFSFADVPEGKYAIAVFLDKNENKKLDVNVLGIPKEQYGFSAKKLPKLRAPKFEEVLFPVSEKERAISVKLK